jgi:hypothetical protein
MESVSSNDNPKLSTNRLFYAHKTPIKITEYPTSLTLYQIHVQLFINYYHQINVTP